MPVSPPVDQKIWDQAKTEASKKNPKQDDAFWESVVNIYKKTKGKGESNSAHSPQRSETSLNKDQKSDAHIAGKNSKQADSASSAVQVLRTPKKESKQMSATNFRFLEQAETVNAPRPTRFRTVLIQEGMGNLRDAFYYTRSALESAAPIFEGKKCFSDHPDAIEEQTRPERSVKDIIGHFENVHMESGSEGQSMLVGDLVIPADPAFDMPRALMSHAVDYSGKYPQSDFIGLSINANGDAKPMDMDDFLKSVQVPAGAMQKIQMARDEGISQVRVVDRITDAVSCDLVTSPGARGKVLELLEGDKKPMSKKLNESENKEAMPEDKSSMKDDEGGDKPKESSEKEADGSDKPAPPAPEKKDGEGEHADADQDKALISEMLKKYIGDGSDESHESEMKQHAAAAMEMGMEKEAAMHCAGFHMKQMKAHKESAEKEELAKKEASGAGGPPSASAEAKESAAKIAKLQGENAALKESLKKKTLDEHVEKKLKESGLRMEITKQIRESAKGLKTPEEFDKHYGNFMSGYKAANPAGEGVVRLFVETEKTAPEVGGKVNFSDCLND